jgi:hypothetical protein
LIPNPILKVLSTMSCHTVRHLLIGGQACVLYGAAEFSRDCDIVILAEEANFENLNAALAELQAECIAIPEFKAEYLERGHAIHFRCKHPDVDGLRIDVMSKLRGCDPFAELWERRTTIQDENANAVYEVLAIEDLVRAKKTQRDKDWPMIRRLLEAHYDENQDDSSEAMVQFWIRESRTPSMLSELIRRFPNSLASFATTRPWLVSVDANDVKQIEAFLRLEEDAERQADEEYWRPLKEELVQLRLNRERRNK